MENTAKLISWLEKYAPVIIPLNKTCVVITYIGGLPTGLWVLWMTYTDPNTTYLFSIIVLFSLAIGFKLGPAPFFAVNCSWIHFQFDRIGLWLPVLSYVIALITLVLTLATNKIIGDLKRSGLRNNQQN